MTVALTDVVEISPEVLCQEVSGEMVLLDLKSESYFGLDVTGARIWQLLQEHGRVSEVHRRMLEEFDVDKDTLGKDLQEHLDTLLAAGLITRPAAAA